MSVQLLSLALTPLAALIIDCSLNCLCYLCCLGLWVYGLMGLWAYGLMGLGGLGGFVDWSGLSSRFFMFISFCSFLFLGVFFVGFAFVWPRKTERETRMCVCWMYTCILYTIYCMLYTAYWILNCVFCTLCLVICFKLCIQYLNITCCWVLLGVAEYVTS